MLRLNRHRTAALTPAEAAMLADVRAHTGSPLFVTEAFTDVDAMERSMLVAHHATCEHLKAANPTLQIGVNIAMSAEEAVGPGGEDALRRCRDYIYAAWMDRARRDDFIGVQTYTRTRIAASGKLPPAPGVPLTQLGYEYWPDALEPTVLYAAAQTGRPV